MQKLLLAFFLLTLCGTSGVAQPQFETFRGMPERIVHDLWVSAETDEKWVASERGLVRIYNDTEKATFKTEFVMQHPLAVLTTDKHQKKWLGGYSSNIYVENEAGEFVPFDFSYRGNFIISDLAANARNEVWAATLGNGLWQVSQRGEATFFTTENSKLESNQVYAVALDGRQTKWIATKDGLQSLDMEGRWDKHRWVRQATALHYDGETLWLAGLDESWRIVLWKKDDARNEWEQVSLPNTVRFGKINDIYLSPKQELWLAGTQLLCRKEGKWESFGHLNGFTSRAAHAVVTDAQDNVWVGTEGKGLMAQIQYPPESSVGEISAPETLDEVLAKKEISPSWLNQEIRIRIQFPQSQATLEPQYFPELDRIGEVLRRFPQLRIELAGHTDNRGRASLNQRLSQQRAESVKSYLVRQWQIPEGRIKTTGYGGSRPIANNQNEETRKLNRRVTVRFLE